MRGITQDFVGECVAPDYDISGDAFSDDFDLIDGSDHESQATTTQKAIGIIIAGGLLAVATFGAKTFINQFRP